jgi:hypothetical protein
MPQTRRQSKITAGSVDLLVSKVLDSPVQNKENEFAGAAKPSSSVAIATQSSTTAVVVANGDDTDTDSNFDFPVQEKSNKRKSSLGVQQDQQPRK